MGDRGTLASKLQEDRHHMGRKISQHATNKAAAVQNSRQETPPPAPCTATPPSHLRRESASTLSWCAAVKGLPPAAAEMALASASNGDCPPATPLKEGTECNATGASPAGTDTTGSASSGGGGGSGGRWPLDGSSCACPSPRACACWCASCSAAASIICSLNAPSRAAEVGDSGGGCASCSAWGASAGRIGDEASGAGGGGGGATVSPGGTAGLRPGGALGLPPAEAVPGALGEAGGGGAFCGGAVAAAVPAATLGVRCSVGGVPAAPTCAERRKFEARRGLAGEFAMWHSCSHPTQWPACALQTHPPTHTCSPGAGVSGPPCLVGDPAADAI